MTIQYAIEQAHIALSKNEVPVGAVVTLNGDVVGKGHNTCITDCDPSAHAEVNAIRAAAARVGNYRLTGAILHVTLEPCSMCIGLILHTRISKVIFGAADPRAGACGSVLSLHQHPAMNHQVEVISGEQSEECAKLLTDFFQTRRPQNDQRLARIQHLSHLPSVDSELVEMLRTAGITQATELKGLNEQQLLSLIKANGRALNPQHHAMIKALAHFINGGPAQSWKTFL
jgi:tRNA(adenine34) deaminase